MSLDDLEKLTSSIQAIVTTVAIIVGGLWAWRRFRREREEHPHIEFTADVTFIERRADWHLVELTSLVENMGKVQHRFDRFEFDLYAILANDPLETSDEFGGQVRFPHLAARGSWLPKQYSYFFIEPGVKAKYSYIARIPASATSVILHSWFAYADGRHSHTAERTVVCPAAD